MSVDDYYGLVRLHRDRIFNLALYSLRHREDAEDVTQEVLIRLWNHRRQLEGPAIGAWLMKVTRNACFDLLRRHGARRRRIGEVEDPATLEEVPSVHPDPHHHAEAADFRDRLQTALRALPEHYRTIVVLREIEGLKYDEIAEHTGRSLSSVKVCLHRGRRMLRDQLSALDPHSADISAHPCPKADAPMAKSTSAAKLREAAAHA